jgi:hypothetical protein
MIYKNPDLWSHNLLFIKEGMVTAMEREVVDSENAKSGSGEVSEFKSGNPP